MSDIPLNPPSLTVSDIQVIDQFRRQKNTAVLTILFTDIKGFTRITEEQGEAYSNKLRHHHDELIAPVIEREGGGRVIKHIGDTVMAVFSEPSTAVERALEAQEKLAQFNRDHPELEDLEVRMGLHSGQVTTEDNVSADIFGRHVNRAARVEALADGGQILVTYPIFDSARGWLTDKSHRPVAWEKHGRYTLKGIEEPIEIYEAYNPALTRPKAPPGGVKSAGGFSRARMAVLAAALILLTAACMYFLPQLGKAEVSVVDYSADWAKLWGGEPFHVGGEPGDYIREVLTPLKKGHHLLYADTSQIVRSFAPFDVKAGKNLLEIRFDRVQLPAVWRRVSYTEEGPNNLQVSEETDFISYDADMTPHENKARIDLDMKAALDPADSNKVNFTVSWVIVLNGKEISRDTVTDSNPIDNNSEIVRRPQKILWEDDFYYYYMSYYLSGSSLDLTLEANFDDYKDR